MYLPGTPLAPETFARSTCNKKSNRAKILRQRVLERGDKHATEREKKRERNSIRMESTTG